MRHKRSTKLEQASLHVHLDIDGDKSTALDEAWHQVRQVIQLIIGQDEIENHDVNLVVKVVVQKRDNLKPPQETSVDLMSEEE